MPSSFERLGNADELYGIPGLPFVPAIRVPADHDLLLIAGVAGSAWGDDDATDLHSETRRAYRRLEHSLRLADATFADVVSVTNHLTDIDRDWAVVVEVMRECFGSHLPTSTTVEVARLVPPDLRVEVTAVAAVPRAISQRPQRH